MAEIFRLILALAVYIFIGWNILYLISSRRNGMAFFEGLCLAYGLGVGFISLEMLLFYFFSLKFSIANILLPWIALLVASLAAYMRHPRHVPDIGLDERKGPIILKTLLIFGILFEAAYAIFRALIRPIEAYDAIAIYAIKSKIFFLAKSINADFLSTTFKLFPHPDYPLNIPFSEVFVYLSLGNLNDQLVKIIFPLFFIGLLAIFYFEIRRFASRAYALLFTFLLATIPQFNAYAANAYVDLPLAYYYFASAVFLFKWIENKEKTHLLLVSACMSGLAGFTKNEGMMYCAINSLVLFIALIGDGERMKMKRIFNFIAYTGVMCIILLPWLWIKNTCSLTNDEIVLANINLSYLMKQLHRIGPILYEYQKQFFGPKKWNIMWPLALLVILIGHKIAFGGIKKYMALSVGLAVAGYTLFYMISPLDAMFFAGKTWSRFIIHFLPVVVYWMALILKDDLKI